ncbi:MULTISPECIES: MaoC/PaaZ C-terminal domain-containing protein [unclassified Sporosarcina]|uniref:MaoC/PaaZ C-terminal domain-containing protein n=1 Tax=unclassified Sporosarcina TaxID=2647733 RepID=UPI000C163B5D|nr:MULTISPECIES: MaoC/PaaZ C-terminal domain-containing protein [unclassified Sporosarcina]PID00765.1 enoyl-CoA hydratase [Sporosarcina sp. P29]PID07175.1 enoyl-CoA hydratase [Sporosarcina sp. P30]PID10371.1 enoyl-CoA hydratase [Sporosarcina sp. P31]PID12955.1 enoyl-CoA hydratase [Sporosarcina sp. P32b]
MLKSRRKLIGKDITELEIGERLHLTEKIEDKDLMLYLGLTNDANPLYLQHDYAAETIYGQPIVPPIMLTGIVTAAISKHMPGPGAHIINQQLHFPKPVYHYSIVEFVLEVTKLEIQSNQVTIQVDATDQEGERIMSGEVVVIAPQKLPVKLAQTKEAADGN